ncbi:MAG: hypothetical protein IBX45_10805 [Campylobacterales bacterium]|nr:hypothetical protein [Campylobacterales bacterium]
MRSAFSMIELVISIVVMGIVVATLPMILLQTQNNLAYALQQEAIMATKAKMGYILAYDWDVNSYEVTSGFTRALNTDGTAADNAFNQVALSVPPRRIGHVQANGRQRLRDATPTPKGTFLADSNRATGYPDIDDFDGVGENIAVTATDYDVVLRTTLTPTINYVSDSLVGGVNYNGKILPFTFATAAAAGITNIKMIEIRTTDTATGGNTIDLTLRAYASNIGESRTLERTW